MKILYVVARPTEINSSASIRNVATINGLVKLGHEVTVISTSYDASHPNYDKSLESKAQIKEYIKQTKEQKIKGLGRKIKILQPLRKFIYKMNMSNNLYGDYVSFANNPTEYINLAEKSDVIISSSDPKISHLFVEKLIKEINISIKWIQIWGDPFLSDITNTNANKKKIFVEEERLIKGADKVIYVSPNTLKNQKNIFPSFKHKMHFVPIPYLEEIKYKKTKNQKLQFLYTGDFNPNVRDVQPLIDSISKFSEEFELKIIGSGVIKKQDYINVKIFNRMKYSDIKNIEAEADVLVFIANKAGGQIPGKIYQYSGTNKPILFINDGTEKEDMKNYFDNFNRYIFSDNDTESITKTLKDSQDSKIFEKMYDSVSDFNMLKVANEIIKDI